jgi:hypothetical protein
MVTRGMSLSAMSNVHAKADRTSRAGSRYRLYKWGAFSFDWGCGDALEQ